MMRGRIRKVISGFYYVETYDRVLICRARGRFRKDGISPLVGDWVEVRNLNDESGVLEEILPRKNALGRPAVANIDQLVAVASGAIPKTDPYLIDRISSIATMKGCRVVVVLNKCDLDMAETLFQIYSKTGFPTVRTSTVTGEGIDALGRLLSGKLSAFTGNSGVGKSSILNALDPSLALPKGEVSVALGRGKHTTRCVEMFHLPDGGSVIDTPGFSSFDTEEMNLELKHHLPETFPEFKPYMGQCRFLDCSHTEEQGCAVLEALRRGDIQESRYRSYLRLYRELKSLPDWQGRKK